MEENEFKMVEKLAMKGFDVGLECSNGQIRVKIGREGHRMEQTTFPLVPMI